MHRKTALLFGHAITLLCAYEAAARWKAGWLAIVPMRPPFK
jgi:hypothetical protein